MYLIGMLLDTIFPEVYVFLKLYWRILKVKSLSFVPFFATPWTVAYQAPTSMGFSRQEYWSGLPFPSPGDLPYPGIEPRSPAFQADPLTSEPPGKPSVRAYVNLIQNWDGLLLQMYHRFQIFLAV